MGSQTTIYTLARDANDRDTWQPVAYVPTTGKPVLVLSTWFDEVEPPAGTYRAEGPDRRAVILGWDGKQAA